MINQSVAIEFRASIDPETKVPSKEREDFTVDIDLFETSDIIEILTNGLDTEKEVITSCVNNLIISKLNKYIKDKDNKLIVSGEQVPLNLFSFEEVVKDYLFSGRKSKKPDDEAINEYTTHYSVVMGELGLTQAQISPVIEFVKTNFKGSIRYNDEVLNRVKNRLNESIDGKVVTNTVATVHNYVIGQIDSFLAANEVAKNPPVFDF